MSMLRLTETQGIILAYLYAVFQELQMFSPVDIPSGVSFRFEEAYDAATHTGLSPEQIWQWCVGGAAS